MAKDSDGGTVLDFSAVKPFEPLDSTVMYLCKVSDLKRDKGPKGPMSVAEFTIEAPEEVSVEEWIADEEVEGGWRKGEGVVDGSATSGKGRKLFRNFSLLPQALPFLYELIKAADPEAELNEAFRYKESDYVGLQVAVKITNEAFDEQVRARVRKILPASAYKA